MPELRDHDKLVWFMTGCCSGLGLTLAREALARGHRVIAADPESAALGDLLSKHAHRAVALRFDPSDAAQVRKAVFEAERVFGHIDVLVHNPSSSLPAAVEEADLAAVQTVLRDWVLNFSLLLQAVLPGMRTRGHGLILSLGSLDARIGQAGAGYDAAGQFANAGLCEALAGEIEPLGLHVMQVATGPLRCADIAPPPARSPGAILDYDATVGSLQNARRAAHGCEPVDPTLAAQAVIAAVQAETPPRRLVLGREAIAAARAHARDELLELDAWEQVGLSVEPAPS